MAEGWNYADIWEAVADRFPDETAQITDDRTITWGDFSARADGVALALVEAGLGRQGKVAQYLYNCPEFLESMFGTPTTSSSTSGTTPMPRPSSSTPNLPKRATGCESDCPTSGPGSAWGGPRCAHRGPRPMKRWPEAHTPG
jgi:hypothetical protein